MKLKIYKIIFAILLIAVIVVIGLIAVKYGKNYLNDQETQKKVETFSRSLENETKENVTMNGYKVIGIVKIPKIELEYPILDIDTTIQKKQKNQ